VSRKWNNWYQNEVDEEKKELTMVQCHHIHRQYIGIVRRSLPGRLRKVPTIIN